MGEISRSSSRRLIKDPIDNNTTENMALKIGDPFFLQSSDYPRMQLMTTSLTGNNYLSWSRSMKIVLGVKVRLDFINGKTKTPI